MRTDYSYRLLQYLEDIMFVLDKIEDRNDEAYGDTRIAYPAYRVYDIEFGIIRVWDKDMIEHVVNTMIPYGKAKWLT